jgi:archaellum component FlaC
MKREMQAIRSLRAKGVSDQTILRWEKIIAQSGLTPGAVQRELAKSASLHNLEAKTQARIEHARLALESIKAKNDELKKKYSTAWDSITRYQLLREAGVDGSVLQRWERLVVGNGLDPEKLEDELLEHRNLNDTKKELEGKLADLGAQLDAARGRLRDAEAELNKLESQRSELLRSVDDITQHFKTSVRVTTEDASERLRGVEAKIGEELRRISTEAQSNLRAELTATTGTVEGFRKKIEEAYESAFQTGQAIGRNEALKPLVRFVETSDGNPGEVVPLMSLLAHSLAKWAEGTDPALAAKAKELEEYLNGKLRGV